MGKRRKPGLDDQLARVRQVLSEDLEDKDHNRADPAAVAKVVDEMAAEFKAVPVEDFVAVLTERKARVVLRARGLKRPWEHLIAKRTGTG
jgi:hypothetical protein